MLAPVLRVSRDAWSGAEVRSSGCLSKGESPFILRTEGGSSYSGKAEGGCWPSASVERARSGDEK